ncbi:unnamed protein product [Soboliphyme baturini]|uniref:Uncharacterized protein n=1 Tax=Soboliphyme baturini TaxID=241478 RepID=A0A183INF6_9BILA|nr:unnamed protein product [Soboliphyme baturini]
MDYGMKRPKTVVTVAAGSLPRWTRMKVRIRNAASVYCRTGLWKTLSNNSNDSFDCDRKPAQRSDETPFVTDLISGPIATTHQLHWSDEKSKVLQRFLTRR